SAAIAEYKTERFGLDRAQLSKAGDLIEGALRIDPNNVRARFWRALIFRAEGKPTDAAARLSQLSREVPGDREVLRQLGQTLFSLGKLFEARSAFEAIIAIDPQDSGAYQFLSPTCLGLGDRPGAERAHALYLEWRDDPNADQVAGRFYGAH